MFPQLLLIANPPPRLLTYLIITVDIVTFLLEESLIQTKLLAPAIIFGPCYS